MLAPLDLLSAFLMRSWLHQTRWLYHWCITAFEAIHWIILQVHWKLLCEYALLHKLLKFFVLILLESHSVSIAPQKLLLWLTTLPGGQSQWVCLCSSHAASRELVKHCMYDLIGVFITLYYIISLSPFPQSIVTTASFNLLSKMSREVPGTDQSFKNI